MKFLNYPAKHWFLFVLLFLSAFPIFCLSSGNFPLGTFGDDAQYYLAAKSILTGKYVHLEHPLEIPIVQFLPGYPILIAPLAAVIGGEYIILNIFSAFCSSLSILCVFLLLKKFTDIRSALIISLLSSLCPLMVANSGIIMSDVPFTLFTWLGMVLFDYYESKHVNLRQSALPQTLCLAAVFAFQFYLRPTAVVLIPSLFFYTIAKKRAKHGLALIGIIIAMIVPLYARNYFITKKYSMDITEFLHLGVSSAIDFAKIFIVNLDFYIKTLTNAVCLPFMKIGFSLMIFFIMATVTLLLFGLIMRWHEKKFELFDYYFVFYALLHLFWPWQDARYIIPVLPIAFFYIISAITFIADTAKISHNWVIAAALVILLTFAPGNIFIISSSIAQNNKLPHKTFEWIKSEIPQNSIFMTASPGVLYIYAKMKSYQHLAAYFNNDMELYRFALKNKVKYFYFGNYENIMPIAAPFSETYKNQLHKMLGFMRNKNLYKLKYENQKEKTLIFQLLPH